MHVQDQGNAIDAGDWRGVANEVKFKIVVQGRIDRVRSVGQEQRMAVGRCAHHRLGGDIAGGAGPVVDEELLTQTVREPLSDQARNDVDLAAGRKPDDNAYRPLRIGLRPAIRGTVGSATAPTAKCRNGRRGSFICLCKAATRVAQSALMLAARMIGHHFSISAFWKAAKASGVCMSRDGTSCPPLEMS